MDASREKKRIEGLAATLKANRRRHRQIFIAAVVSQLLCLVITIVYVLLLNWLMNGHFWNFGFNYNKKYLFKGEIMFWNEIMVPGMASCNITKIGVTGSKEYSSLQCVLTMCHSIRKELFILWIFLFFLVVMDVASVFFLLMSLLSGKKSYLSSMVHGTITIHDLKRWVGNLEISDLFVLDKIGENSDPVTFGLVLKAIGGVLTDEDF